MTSAENRSLHSNGSSQYIHNSGWKQCVLVECNSLTHSLQHLNLLMLAQGQSIFRYKCSVLQHVIKSVFNTSFKLLTSNRNWIVNKESIYKVLKQLPLYTQIFFCSCAFTSTIFTCSFSFIDNNDRKYGSDSVIRFVYWMSYDSSFSILTGHGLDG
jgi:hypothetical protein